MSITYFYVAAAKEPFGHPATIELTVTIVLFTANVCAVLIFFAFIGSETVGLRETCMKKRSTALAVGNAAQTHAALAAPNAANDKELWHHPSGVAVGMPPKHVEGAVQLWPASEGVEIAVSTTEVELLLEVDDVASLPAGATFRWMDNSTHKLSDVQTVPEDVGGWSCCGGEGAAEGGVGGNADGPGLQMMFINNPADRAAARVAAGQSTESTASSTESTESTDASDGESSEERDDSDSDDGSDDGGDEAFMRDAGDVAVVAAVEHIAIEVQPVHPRGWSEHVSEEGHTYYNNDHTNETTWYAPEHPAPPAGWNVVPHEGHVYYEHIATGTTQLRHPDDDETHASGMA